MLRNIGFIWNCLQLCSNSISSFASQRNSACLTDLFSLFFLIVCYYSSSNVVLTNLNTSEHFVTVILSRWCYCQWCVLGLKHTPLYLHHLHITHAHPAWGPTAAAHQHNRSHQACSRQWHRPANHFCHCTLITSCCTDQYVAQSCVTAAGERSQQAKCSPGPHGELSCDPLTNSVLKVKIKHRIFRSDVGLVETLNVCRKRFRNHSLLYLREES